ncbi:MULTISPECIES: hypothetical protein [Rhodopirellula]|jgi:hypothetical protein|uniref:hypothetical protein n=1 Tax=Rhodopirellula TaxID=265488 RepID=UPI00257BEA6B|nr:hypothetical protein [Rhodopirellula sp. UBA1907]MCR9207433.1 hypothetical protein [bacterium]
MLLKFRTLCLVVALAGCGPLATADQPSPQQLTDTASNIAANGTGESVHEDRPILVVAHKSLLDRIATWTDAPAECLFDRENLADDNAQRTVPALPIARLLNAKCYLYCPSEELPIEAIYRERLANHGVKVISIASPSQRRNQELQKSALLAKLQ